ncbi:MAG: glycosyltransferase family 2 protein [Acidimicrobiales bacterium]
MSDAGAPDGHGPRVTPTLSVVLKVRDEEAMLPGCLRRLAFADEVVAAVDDRTTDRSVEILTDAGVRVAMVPFESADRAGESGGDSGFARLANAAMALATGDWLFLLDADERVSRALAAEISSAITGPFDGLRVPIANYFHGRHMDYGAWQEHPLRLWRRGAARYAGALHERPVFSVDNPRLGDLVSPLSHFSHRSVLDNLEKSTNYVEVQARAQHASGAPPVTPWQLYRTLIREVGFRLVLRRGWRDGVVGVYEALYWPFSHMCAQARLWELQQVPPIDEQYRELEDSTW